MSTGPRREWGSAKTFPQLNTKVPQEDKDFFHEVAKRSGVSANEFMEKFIKHLRTEILEDGLPSWYDREEALFSKAS